MSTNLDILKRRFGLMGKVDPPAPGDEKLLSPEPDTVEEIQKYMENTERAVNE